MNEDETTLAQATISGDTIRADLYYPRTDPVKYVEVDMYDVRATAGIRVSFDFARDGWKIEQPTIFEWASDDAICDPGWREVAFVPSWPEGTP